MHAGARTLHADGTHLAYLCARMTICDVQWRQAAACHKPSKFASPSVIGVCTSYLIDPIPVPAPQVLADFWWASVVPAKHDIAAAKFGGAGGATPAALHLHPGAPPLLDLEVAAQAAAAYRPAAAHRLTRKLMEDSKAMARAAPTKVFSAE